MIAFRDFVPRQLRAPRLSFHVEQLVGEYESFAAALAAANEWLASQPVRVLNVETVVLPNLWSPREAGSQDPALAVQEGAVFHQFIRIWYEAEGARSDG